MKTRASALLLAFLTVLAIPLDAQEAAADPPAGSQRWQSHHAVRVGGQVVEYDATVGSIVIRDRDETPTGEIFYTAYIRSGVEDRSRRPIMFSYNGGPGSSSFWLHMGIMGPRRVSTPGTEHSDPAPYDIQDNAFTLLDKTDVVMVDPVGTGFSRTLGDTEGSTFWGVDEDARSLTQFVQRFLSEYKRWNSPKYLLGESYGTMRSALLSRTLQGANIDLNGVVLVSTVLDLQTLIFSANADLPYIVNLPSLAVVARYLDALPTPAPDLQAFMAEVEAFAIGDYATALLAGNRLSATDRADIIQRMHRYTGLDTDYLERAKLRVSAPDFEKELLRDQGKVVGRLDARFTGHSGDLLDRRPDQDPQSSAISAPYAAAWNTYLREELGYDGDREYVPSGNVQPWNWTHGPNAGFGQTGFTNVGPDLRAALERNPKLEVLLVNGIYDLATPYFAAVWTMDHLGLPAELRDNIQRADFEAGHMMYVHEPVLPLWKGTLDAFIDRTSGVAAARRPVSPD